MSSQYSGSAWSDTDGGRDFFAPRNEREQRLAEKSCPNRRQFEFVGTYPFGVPDQLMECYTHTTI